ncbi:hypothetical protein AB0D84_31450 [Streptomyces sp. NPDC048193]|uniref:hypothetical protein n=1 Tax=unclassified Streptomyces TaxID=2593676 RepID=UPI00341E103B
MATNTPAAAADSADEGLQRVPVALKVREVPAATEARDSLLSAIAAEAKEVSDRHKGQSSVALESLARAYALVTSGTMVTNAATGGTTAAVQGRSGGHQVGLCLELEP